MMHLGAGIKDYTVDGESSRRERLAPAKEIDFYLLLMARRPGQIDYTHGSVAGILRKTGALRM
jgi:hypothetical protein